MSPLTRRDFLGATAVSAAALAFPNVLRSDDSLDAIQAEIVKRHAEGIARLQEWVRQPSIAAEKRGMEEGCDADDALCAGGRLPAGHPRPHRRPARRLRHAGRRRAADRRPLLHVRRQAGRSGRVVLAAVGGGARRQARLRQGADGPRRGEPEGSRGRVPGRSPRHPRRRPEVPGQPRAGGGGGGGDRLAALPAGRAPARGERRAQGAARASSCPRRRRTRTAP